MYIVPGDSARISEGRGFGFHLHVYRVQHSVLPGRLLMLLNFWFILFFSSDCELSILSLWQVSKHLSAGWSPALFLKARSVFVYAAQITQAQMSSAREGQRHKSQFQLEGCVKIK